MIHFSTAARALEREKGLAALAHVIAQAPVGIAVEQNLENQQHGQQQGQDGKKGTSQNTSRPENGKFLTGLQILFTPAKIVQH